jgi:hypothetical protein
MRFRHLCVVLALAVVAPSLLADGTIRYTSIITYGPIAAAFAATEAANGKPSINITPPAPTSRTMRLKNGKVEQEGGAITGFYDPKNAQVTFIDPQRKLFATTTLQDLVAQLLASMPARPPMSPQVKMIVESLTTTFASRKTGRTEMTLGLETEETEFTFSVNMTLPPALLALLPNVSVQPGAPVTVLKIVLHMWYPTQAEIARVPALSELAGFWSAQTAMSANLTAGLIAATAKLSANYPGISQGLTAMIEDSLKNRGAMLKSDAEIYAPVLAQIAPLMKAHGMADFDVNAPVMAVTTEAVEVSSAPIEDSVFEVPGDYKATPVADFLRGAGRSMNAAHAGRAGGSLEPGPPAQPADAEGLERIPFR